MKRRSKTFKYEARHAIKPKRSEAWRTLYITGRPGCDQVVNSCLTRQKIDFITGSFDQKGTYLFWVTDTFDLKRFRWAIGGELTFRYRLRFYFSVDSFIAFRDKEEKNHHFTPDQEQMFRDMN